MGQWNFDCPFMIALEEIELIDPAEIVELEENIKRLPDRVELDPHESIYRALESFRGTTYAILVGQFSALSAHYLSFRAMILDIKATAVTPEVALRLKPATQEVKAKFHSVGAQLSDAAAVFDGERLSLINEMSDMIRRMIANANDLEMFCDAVLVTGNRAFRRALRKNGPPSSHMPKVPMTEPRPKPKR